MKKWKMPKGAINKTKEKRKFFALQEKILPQWKKIALEVLSDEETILINNTTCNVFLN